MNLIQYNTSWGTETPPGTSLQAIWLMGDQAYSFNTVIVPYPNHFYVIQRAVHPAAWQQYVPEFICLNCLPSWFCAASGRDHAVVSFSCIQNRPDPPYIPSLKPY
jgi:hypothetical protein